MLTADDRDPVAELAPVLRRALDLDPRSLVRFRFEGAAATALVRLPFAILVSRTVDMAPRETPLDLTARAAEIVGWLDGGEHPEPRDLEWRTGIPPRTGWQRVETVPDSVLRPLVRAGALTLKEAAEREGVPGAQPRAQVTDALLDSVVLTATAGGLIAEVTLRAVSALTRMGFLPRGGHAYVDVAGRWVRLLAEYGTVYLERRGQGLTLN